MVRCAQQGTKEMQLFIGSQKDGTPLQVCCAASGIEMEDQPRLPVNSRYATSTCRLSAATCRPCRSPSTQTSGWRSVAVRCDTNQTPCTVS